MTSLLVRPIAPHWTSRPVEAGAGRRAERAGRAGATAGAGDVVDRLAAIEIGRIPATIVADLAAAVDEVARAVGSASRFNERDPPVVLLRGMATFARRHPTAGGPRTRHLFARLAEITDPA